MILENTELTKYTFSGHDSFQCRQLWLKKGYDYVQEGKNFNDEDAVVQLGVGKNMVSSIRFWLKAFNIIDNKDIPTEFGKRLFDDENGYDPFLEDEASLWLLHYQLVKNSFASIYSIIFNEFRKEKLFFNKDTFVNYVKRIGESNPDLNFNENTVAKDFIVFTNLYKSNPESKDVEDSFSGILSEIELLKTTGKGTYDSNTPMFERAKELDKTKLESGLLMLQRALKNKFKAKYILADSWFSRIEFIKGIRKISKNQVHYLGIGRMDSTRYITEGVGWKANLIISRHSRKRKRINKEYKSEYFIVNCVNHDCPVKLIFIRNLGSDKWCFLLTTDMDLSFQRAYELYNIRAYELYNIRWSIEVLFKECKQYFKLGRCQAEYLSEQIANCTMALITHTLVSLENRFANYETLGGLYTEIDSQIALMTLWKRILKLIITLMIILATIISEPIMEVVRRIIIRNHSEIKLLFQMIKTELLKDPDFDNFNPIYC